MLWHSLETSHWDASNKYPYVLWRNQKKYLVATLSYLEVRRRISACHFVHCTYFKNSKSQTWANTLKHDKMRRVIRIYTVCRRIWTVFALLAFSNCIFVAVVDICLVKLNKCSNFGRGSLIKHVCEILLNSCHWTRRTCSLKIFYL